MTATATMLMNVILDERGNVVATAPVMEHDGIRLRMLPGSPDQHLCEDVEVPCAFAELEPSALHVQLRDYVANELGGTATQRREAPQEVTMPNGTGASVLDAPNVPVDAPVSRGATETARGAGKRPAQAVDNAILVEQATLRTLFSVPGVDNTITFNKDEPNTCAGTSNSLVLRSSDDVLIEFDVVKHPEFTVGASTKGTSDIASLVHQLERMKLGPTLPDDVLDLLNSVRQIGSGEQTNFTFHLNTWTIQITDDNDPSDLAGTGTEKDDIYPISTMDAMLRVHGKFIVSDDDGDGWFTLDASLSDDTTTETGFLAVNKLGTISYSNFTTLPSTASGGGTSSISPSTGVAQGDQVQKKFCYAFTGIIKRAGMKRESGGFPLRFEIVVNAGAKDDPFGNSAIVYIDELSLKLQPHHAGG